MAETAILGWDIGGAHVKAVQLRADGAPVRAWHLPAPVWKGLARTQEAVRAVRAQARCADAARHVVTMTAELADIFAHRAEGVRRIGAGVSAVLGPEPVCYFAQGAGFVDDPAACAARVASRNWLASALLCARIVERGVLVDIGSTTTDLTAIRGHRAHPRGFDDAQRLATGALLYTGVARTPLMSLAPRIRWRGAWRNVVAEHFATTADVYRLLDALPASLLPYATADGAPCDARACARRLARTVGMDCTGADLAPWRALARAYAAAHRARIAQSLRDCAGDAGVLVGAGSGRFVLPACARDCGLEYRDIDSLLPGPASGLADCLAAYAVAELWRADHADG